MNCLRSVAPALILLACTPKPADTIGDTGTSSGMTDGAEATSATAPTSSAGSTSVGMTSDGPTTVPGTTPTSAEDSGTVPGTSSDSGTDTGTDTGGNPGLPGACSRVCMRWDMCEPGSAGPVDACTKNCFAGIEVPSPCAMAQAALVNCVADLPCEEALKFLGGPDDPPPTSCLDELQFADEVCAEGPPGCGSEVSGGDDFCEFEQDCDGMVQNFHCDTEANLCTCTEDGVLGKQCPNDGFCALDHAEQSAKINACCGWQWK